MLVTQAHPEMAVLLDDEWPEGHTPGGIEGTIKFIADPIFQSRAFGAENDAVIFRLAIKAAMLIGAGRDANHAEVQEIESVEPGFAAKGQVDRSANLEDLSAIVRMEVFPLANQALEDVQCGGIGH